MTTAGNLVQDCAVTVNEYIAAADPDRREALRALRGILRDTAPQAREEIRHKMPYYVYHGDPIAFASQKNHFSVYVMGPRLSDHLHELCKLDCGKGCIRFKNSGPPARSAPRDRAGDRGGERESRELTFIAPEHVRGHSRRCPSERHVAGS